MEAVYHHLTLYNGNYRFHTQPCTECLKSNLNCVHTKYRLNMHFKFLTNQTAWTFLWTCLTEQMKMVLWGHAEFASHINPFTALFRAQFNTCTSLQSGPFQAPKATLLRAQISSPNQSQVSLFWPIIGQFIMTNHRTSHQPRGLNKKRSFGPGCLAWLAI